MKLFGHKHNGEDEQHEEHGVILEADHLSKAFDEKVVLKDVSLEVRQHETLAVLGKSGTGKSVLLKLIVGLLQPDSGSIIYEGKHVEQLKEAELTELRKSVGFLFQGAALFDSMTVGENLDIFLEKHTKISTSEREKKIQRALELVGLSNVIDSMPSELSGGMKKRAGLARSIVTEPKLMLYDEPTTGLDPLTAASIAELILYLQIELGIASIVVTHDLPTAFTVSDRSIVLDKGLKIFDGTMDDLAKSNDPYLGEYIHASQMNRARREEILQNPHALKDKIAHG